MPKLTQTIEQYNSSQSGVTKQICMELWTIINKSLPKAESKIWYAAPVWFRDGNPLVGYSIRKVGVTLLFWSGQAFEESGLTVEGKFKAAQKVYSLLLDINQLELKRWLKKSWTLMYDYKNVIKNKGKINGLLEL
jgi:hypothetical protein